MEKTKDRELREEAIQAAIRYYEFKHKRNDKPFTPGDHIPYAGRVFDEKEIINLIDASLDFWLTTGRYADKFEKEFAEILGVKHSSLTNSGSSANLLAFMALTSPKLGERSIKRGDEVITVAAGFPTTVAPIIQYGAVPVFVDVSLPTYNIDISMLEKALSPKIKAVMAAHTLGISFNIEKVLAVANRYNLWLIEDNGGTLGTTYDGRYTETFGHISTFSFYPLLHITMGEGGAVLTNDTLLKRIVESFRDWERDCGCILDKDRRCSKQFRWYFSNWLDVYECMPQVVLL